MLPFLASTIPNVLAIAKGVAALNNQLVKKCVLNINILSRNLGKISFSFQMHRDL